MHVYTHACPFLIVVYLKKLKLFDGTKIRIEYLKQNEMLKIHEKQVVAIHDSAQICV
jgi:hypothetical protein